MADESTVGLGDALQMATRNGAGFGGAISVPITAAVRPCCKPSRINFSVNVAGTAGEVQVRGNELIASRCII